MARAAIQKATIRLKTRVISIDNSLALPDHDPKVLVSTETDIYEFDEVIVTSPLGCLKQGQIKFSPSLPLKLTKALEHASYSGLEKVFFCFPAAFWDAAPSDTSSVSGSACLPEASGLPTFVHFLGPQYTSQNPQSWTLEVQSLSSKEIFGDEARAILIFTIWGPCADHVTSMITGIEPSSSSYTRSLDDFFKPYYSLLPNYDASQAYCQPDGVLATNWKNDALAGHGTYTNFKIHAATSDEKHGDVPLQESLAVIRNGLPDRGIWLAGEHAAPFVALGTLTGAYWSGEAVGLRVLGAHGLADVAEVEAD